MPETLRRSAERINQTLFMKNNKARRILNGISIANAAMVSACLLVILTQPLNNWELGFLVVCIALNSLCSIGVQIAKKRLTDEA